ncbi:hypothetical protein LX32DRAFT_721305 [Colletotrichum zoysiae]|uniref:BTB domain-containing protein n=1 Tax=Colletotrichum zoysiae TaxID=1216348 RepID=A0AAD9M4M5_9PEZI|nr:hypothetical protein LX32DRAFT_721305 [Colletotrichum zoysiae]
MPGIDLSHLLATGEYSDLTINAAGVIHRVHRCIVFPQCEAWKNMPEVNGQIILTGPNVTRAVLEFMYSGTYTPVNIQCRLTEPPHTAIDDGETGKFSSAAKGPHDHPQAQDSDILSYDDHSMLLSAHVMTKAKEYQIQGLVSQARSALVAVAPSLTEHAEFIYTIKHILKHHKDKEGLETVVQMIKPGFSKSASMRRRLRGAMGSYPHLAVELLEPLMLELELIAKSLHKKTDWGAGVSSPVFPGPPRRSVQPESPSPLAIPPSQDGSGSLKETTKGEQQLELHQIAEAGYTFTLSAVPTGDAALAPALPVPRPTTTVPKKRKHEEQLPEQEKRNKHTVNQSTATDCGQGEGESRPAR